MWSKITAFAVKHDSYLTGMIVWMNLVSFFQSLAKGDYTWAVISLIFVVWFQYEYNRKMKNGIDN